MNPNAKALQLLKQIDPREYDDLLLLIKQIEEAEVYQDARTNFLTFVKLMWPGFIHGAHHKVMAKIIEDQILGNETRSIINLAPRHTKSEFFSYLAPAWALGLKPDWKIIQICGTGEMAIGWSRKVRNLVATDDYQKVFPKIGLRADSKAAGRWHTSHGGEYFAVGAEGNVTGKGGDLVIIDDPTGEQQAVSAIGDPSVYRKVYDWYVAGPRQRLQPGGRICVVQSRWAINDFTGQLLKAQKESDNSYSDEWRQIELPAILPSGKALWPEYWDFKLLEGTRLSLPPHRWDAQYMQRPSNDSSSIIKRDWWRRWQRPKAPDCSLKLVTVDTAYSTKESSDYTAFTTWGVFNAPSLGTEYANGDTKDPGGKEVSNLILLDAWKERLDFPELKAVAHRHWLKWQPDVFMVEAKAAGAPLIYELRARGIPVQEYNPTRGSRFAPNDKITRVNAITDIFASGMVWAPMYHWAEEVIEDCANFPQIEHDDIVDCVAMALMRFRQGGLISLANDDWDDKPQARRRAAYY